MGCNIIILLNKHINNNISNIFIKNLYETNLQYINNLNLVIKNYIAFYYNGYIIVNSIDANNQEIKNIMKQILNLKNIKIYNEQQNIKDVFIINIDTKTYNNKENNIKIDELKLKINSFTLKNDNIYELFISSDIYPQLIMIKNMIDNNV